MDCPLELHHAGARPFAPEVLRQPASAKRFAFPHNDTLVLEESRVWGLHRFRRQRKKKTALKPGVGTKRRSLGCHEMARRGHSKQVAGRIRWPLRRPEGELP